MTTTIKPGDRVKWIARGPGYKMIYKGVVSQITGKNALVRATEMADVTYLRDGEQPQFKVMPLSKVYRTLKLQLAPLPEKS